MAPRAARERGAPTAAAPPSRERTAGARPPGQGRALVYCTLYTAHCTLYTVQDLSHACVQVRLSLWNTSHVFAAGHRLRAVVTSANHPRFSASPNRFGRLDDPNASPVVATNTLWHDALRPSALLLPVVSLAQLPEHRILEQARHPIGIVSGSYRDRIGILLGSYIGIVSGSCWVPIGILLRSCWDPVGILLRSYRDCIGNRSGY